MNIFHFLPERLEITFYQNQSDLHCKNNEAAVLDRESWADQKRDAPYHNNGRPLELLQDI